MKRETKFLLGGVAAGFVLGVLVCVVVSLAAVLILRPSEPSELSQKAEGSAHDFALAEGSAHDFALEDVNPASATYGQTLRLSTLWKKSGIVVNFMASWCMPCRVELPALQAIHASGDATIVCVAADEEAGTSDLLALVSSSGLTLPVLYAPPDRAAELNQAYTHDVLPSTYLIGSDGKIRQLISGARPEGAFREAITSSLAGPSARLR